VPQAVTASCHLCRSCQPGDNEMQIIYSALLAAGDVGKLPLHTARNAVNESG